MEPSVRAVKRRRTLCGRVDQTHANGITGRDVKFERSHVMVAQRWIGNVLVGAVGLALKSEDI